MPCTGDRARRGGTEGFSDWFVDRATKLCNAEDLDGSVWKEKELEVKIPQKRHRDRRLDKFARTFGRHAGRRVHAPWMKKGSAVGLIAAVRQYNAPSLRFLVLGISSTICSNPSQVERSLTLSSCLC